MSTLEWMLYSEVLIACHTPHGTKVAGGEEHCSVLQPLQLAWHGGFREWVLLPKTERHPG